MLAAKEREEAEEAEEEEEQAITETEGFPYWAWRASAGRKEILSVSSVPRWPTHLNAKEEEESLFVTPAALDQH